MMGENSIPVFIGLKFIGKKFTISSVCVIVLSGLLTDIIPSQPITYDTLLISIFGGLINGFCISLCLIGNTSTGGTDFIAIYFSEKNGRDIWNYILCGNAVILTVAGLLFGWLRSKHPTFGGIPEPSLWVLNNVGLNMFIAVVGIAAGPSFIAGFKEVGVSLFIVGALATAIPLVSGLLMAKYLFKFHPALSLGCTAGARTTTAALGAIQDAVESDTPALGYTVTYAVGNTLLIIWGVVIVLLM